MNRQPDKPSPPSRAWAEGLLATVTGIWLGLALLKFGNPVIFHDKVSKPEGFYQWLIQPWPIALGFAAFVLVAIAGMFVWRRNPGVPRWIVGLPLAWFCWQVAASIQTVDVGLTRITLMHFVVCVGCFYLGLFSLSRVQDLTALWAGWIVGYGLVLALGFEQHWGGLEETRQWFFTYQLPALKEAPSPEFLQKLASDRIYSTLFYPNTLAGAILLLTPIGVTWLVTAQRLTGPVRIVLGAGIGLGSLACLIWSGSKAGWLIALLLAVAAVLEWPLRKPIKAWILGGVILVGLAGFSVAHGAYVSRGAKSAAARIEYWRAAVQAMKQRPLLGSGPGTFGVIYSRLKSPESEMAKLAHNDYLQQGSDAGIPGLLGYSALIAGSLVILYRKRSVSRQVCAVWIGLLGLALQGMVEFGLFIPALAWPQFLLLGWLWGTDDRGKSDYYRRRAEPPILSSGG